MLNFIPLAIMIISLLMKNTESLIPDLQLQDANYVELILPEQQFNRQEMVGNYSLPIFLTFLTFGRVLQFMSIFCYWYQTKAKSINKNNHGRGA